MKMSSKPKIGLTDGGGKNMANLEFHKEITALLVIDPYNDFISEGGKVWPRIKNVAEANNCVPHISQVVAAARKAGIRVFYAMHPLPSGRLRDHALFLFVLGR
jgi:nicotinamidase-related amidase